MKSNYSDGWKRNIPRNGLILLILTVFITAGVHRSLNEDGDDLSTSFIGCRLINSGQISHLFAHDPDSFAEIGFDKPWQQAADDGHYMAYLHPYVQTPLWAWSLQPLCRGRNSDFYAFQKIFAVLSLCSFAACIWLVAFFWAPSLYNPVAITLLCGGLWFAEPFQYALALMQTHVLFLLLTLLALLLADKKQPTVAGILLAVAATVKLTPAAILLYWLVTGRWRAAASMVVTCAMLYAISYLAVGSSAMHAYSVSLDRISHVLLLSQNNQSFSAWIMSLAYPADEALAFQTYSLPDWLRILSGGLLIACVLGGGLIDRRLASRLRRPGEGGFEAPLGGLFALVASTIFAPISWSHYSIVLIAPIMVLLHQQNLRIEPWLVSNRFPFKLQRRGDFHLSLRLSTFWIAACLVPIAALNYQPFAAAAVETVIHPLTLVRSHFYAQVLCLIALGAVAFDQLRHMTARRSQPQDSQESLSIAATVTASKS